MVLFEGAEFDPKNSVKYITEPGPMRLLDLEEVLIKLKNEFLEVMAPRIGLENAPNILPIRFLKLTPYPTKDDNFIYLPFPHSFKENGDVNHLTKLGFYCLHEAGHHLHQFANPKVNFYRKGYQQREKVEDDIFYLFESVAELSAIIFYNLTNRELPKNLNEFYHPIVDTLHSFLQEKGINYSMKTLSKFVYLDPGKMNTDLYEIKKRTRKIRR